MKKERERKKAWLSVGHRREVQHRNMAIAQLYGARLRRFAGRAMHSL